MCIHHWLEDRSVQTFEDNINVTDALNHNLHIPKDTQKIHSTGITMILKKNVHSCFSLQCCIHARQGHYL